MKSLEKARNKLNKAIVAGCSKDVILNISRQVDDLIVEQMKIKNKKYITKGQ
jgi:hypothetical protein